MNQSPFDLTDRVAVITGGGGLLGRQHAAAISSAGGIPVLWDCVIDSPGLDEGSLKSKFGARASIQKVDITSEQSVREATKEVFARYGRIDILINNAANNPKMESSSGVEFSRLENFPISQWEADLNVGLKGAFLCARTIGALMAKQGRGVIINIASDLAVIAPDQRLYRRDGVEEKEQPVKPVTYSVVKSGLIGLTRYLATYWCDQGVRCNALSPGGVENGQPEGFMGKLSWLIPLGRMARPDEYQGALLFLCSDASSYMNGQNLVVDGGRSCW
jgi:NAD(P)-dependent dehydrogenase (short-subunit alcohol dehydrogenase family)